MHAAHRSPGPKSQMRASAAFRSSTSPRLTSASTSRSPNSKVLTIRRFIRHKAPSIWATSMGSPLRAHRTLVLDATRRRGVHRPEEPGERLRARDLGSAEIKLVQAQRERARAYFCELLRLHVQECRVLGSLCAVAGGPRSTRVTFRRAATCPCDEGTDSSRHETCSGSSRDRGNCRSY